MAGSRLNGSAPAAIVRRMAEHLRLSVEDCAELLDGVAPDIRFRGLVDLEVLARTHPLPAPHPALGDVLRAIHAWCGSDARFTVSSLRSAAQHRETLRLALQPVGGGAENGRQLGKFLACAEGRVVDGHMLRVIERAGRDGNVYVLAGAA